MLKSIERLSSALISSLCTPFFKELPFGLLYRGSTNTITYYFGLKLNRVKQMTLPYIHLYTGSHAVTHKHTHVHFLKEFNKNISIRQSPPMNEFHLLFTLMAFSICHKTILPQQIHSTVHIIIMHLNANTVWQDMQCQMCVAEYLHTTGERHCSQKNNIYAHILYIENASLCLHSPSHSLVCLSPAFPRALSCGRQHWAHRHATSICELVKRFPCFPPCCSL